MSRPRPTFGVRVVVDSQDTQVGRAFESHLSRELRAIDDVVVRDEDYHWTIRILQMQIVNREQNLGYAVSVVLTYQTKGGVEAFFYQSIKSGSSDEHMRLQCRDIVNTLDSEGLAMSRKDFDDELRRGPRPDPRKVQ